MHDFSFPSKITQRFLFAQNGDDLGKKLSDRDCSDLFVLDKIGGT